MPRRSSKPASAKSSEMPPMPEGMPPRPALRVSYIRRLMAVGAWVTGETGPQLAARWGLNETTLRGDAAEASRAQREAIGDIDEMRAVIFGMVNEAVRRARNDPENARSAVAMLKAAELIARMTGAANSRQYIPKLTPPEEAVPFGWKRSVDGEAGAEAATDGESALESFGDAGTHGQPH
jgi:hypothetical protein